MMNYGDLIQDNRSQHPNHRLGMKVIGGLIISYGIYLVLYIFLGLSFTFFRQWLQLPSLLDSLVFAIMIGSLTVIAGILFTITTHKTLQRSLLAISLKRTDYWWLDLVFGIFITLIALSSVFIVVTTLGWLRVEYWVWERESVDILMTSMVRSLAITVGVAMLEELLFRGYVLTGLKEAWGERTGLLSMSFLFILVHTGMSITALSLYGSLVGIFFYWIQIFMFAYVVGYAYLRTRMLWLPIGVHFAFNLFLDDVFNFGADNRGSNTFGAITYLAAPNWVFGTLILALVLLAIGVWCWVQLLHGSSPSPLVSFFRHFRNRD